VVYSFIREHTEGLFPTNVVCSVLGVSRSAYYDYRQGKSHVLSTSKAEVSKVVSRIFKEHLSRYGARRIVAEMQEEGYKVGLYVVRQRMKEQGLRAIQPRSFVPKTTQTDPLLRRSDNLLLDLPPIEQINEVFVGDITYIPMKDGSFIYLATWMDLCSRYIVGWALKTHMESSLIFEALKKAFAKRQPPKGIIIHSDGGGQYMATDFRIWLNEQEALQSMTRKDNHYDNAFAESLFSRFKAELIQRGTFDAFDDAQTAIFEYIEIYYNRKRRHSSLNYLSPENFEKRLLKS
jgi:putative transposase